MDFIGVIVSLVLMAVGAVVLFFVVRGAVLSALEMHATRSRAAEAAAARGKREAADW